MNAEKLEKYTSAITLSDMEIFVFPELMYSLVLANIMSPVIWRWCQNSSFSKLKGKDPYRKLMRLKQFIMDEYEFNLDLETWGLTSQQKELKRFEKFISPEDIAKSNALFGYHGDKYYFDVDIRRHFGLDKYDSDVIPYWKTETVEAMDAFVHREGYKSSAGECVSLAALYAAAAFVVCGIPLKDIYMVLTPLHSQNFLDIKDGVLTNNRRLVTKTMWFNGTAISDKAQRALRNEKVIIVTHNSGFVHCLYKNATMDFDSYRNFTTRLDNYLTTGLNTLILANFLRRYSQYQQFFQFCCEHCRRGQRYVKAEVLFHYEHDSNYRIADETFERLLDEVSEEETMPYKLINRMCCRQLTAFTGYENIDMTKEADRASLRKYIAPFVPDADGFVRDLANFVHVKAQLPGFDRNFADSNTIDIGADFTREQVIEYLGEKRKTNTTADLAFYAYRDMETCSWTPFLKAAIERNPVSLEMAESMSVDEVYTWLEQMQDVSIYDGPRLAQPDEVANYSRADGLEKAFLLANVLRQKQPEQDIRITVDNNEVMLQANARYSFVSNKQLKKEITLRADGEILSD